MSPSVFVSSWLFAPYTGSADVDLFKRLRHCDADFEVVQVRGRLADKRLLEFPCRARFMRHEVDLEGAHPRSEAARERFVGAVLERFSPARHQVLLSHSNEVPSHAAALQLKRMHPEVPWVAYFGDLVSQNPYVRHMHDYPLFEDDCFVEEQTLRNADIVVCNNRHQASLMAGRVPRDAGAPVVVVPHCYEPAFVAQESVPPAEVFTFMHLGALYPVKRLARPVLEAVELLLEVYPALAGRFQVLFIGDEVCDADLATWRAMRHASVVRFVPGVSYLASLDLMRRADALVLIDGVFSHQQDGLSASPFMPGKLADYLGAGRRVLGVSMEQGPTAELLVAAGQPVVADDPKAIAFAMKRLLEGRFPQPSPPLRLRAELVAAEMELVLRAALGGGAAIEALPRLHERLVSETLRPGEAG